MGRWLRNRKGTDLRNLLLRGLDNRRWKLDCLQIARYLLFYLLERLLAEPNRLSEVDAKTKEVKTGPSGDLTSSHDLDPR
jgi:hypothetical protein